VKLLWFAAAPGEAEYDMWVSCQEDGIEVDLYGLQSGWHFGDPPGVKLNLINSSQVAQIVDSTPHDLCIFRYPQNWELPQDMSKVVCWTSEQGPTRQFAEISARPYQKVAVNNKVDLEYYKNTYPNKRIFYLPFCSRPSYSRKAVSYAIVTSSVPHYVCGCEGGLKRQSFDVMINPLLKLDIAAYGLAISDHGWFVVPGIEGKYKGEFPHWAYKDYLAQGKLYVDTTWNWKDGGFGVKLARALSTGTPILWHQTVGMELEGFEKGNQLDWSSSPEKTLELARSYDKEMGRRGYEWFLNNWVWSKNLKRLADEL
jgi:hypothetical protein